MIEAQSSNFVADTTLIQFVATCNNICFLFLLMRKFLIFMVRTNAEKI
jgi:hypothetical protein